jgi:hypothetical protein
MLLEVHGSLILRNPEQMQERGRDKIRYPDVARGPWKSKMIFFLNIKITTYSIDLVQSGLTCQIYYSGYEIMITL